MPAKKKAWIVSVDMGYGHQRAAYPLRHLAHERILTANSDNIISPKERKQWDHLRAVYEFLSKAKDIPVIGQFIFNMYDNFQSIRPFFPFRDLSKPNYAALYFRRLVLKKGICKSLIEYVKKEDIPFISTHFAPALAAHYLGIKKVYCVVTDTDINRVWVPVNPKENTITYLIPTRHVERRLKEYGISDNKIIFTGFPLPQENIGGRNHRILRQDLANRLPNLDPKRVYLSQYRDTIKHYLGKFSRVKNHHPLTITYTIGGAGAQRDIGIKIITSLAEKIKKGMVHINLVAATHLDVRSYYEAQITKLGMKKYLGKNITIIFATTREAYFRAFNESLHTTDILWTKPSELSFYTALGLPIILSPPVGAHEKFNREWLEHIGTAFIQENPQYVNDWLYYWLETGRFAEAAWEGYLEAHVDGSYEIERVVFR